LSCVALGAFAPAPPPQQQKIIISTEPRGGVGQEEEVGQGQGTQSDGPVERGEAEAVPRSALFFGQPASHEGHDVLLADLAGGLVGGLTQINWMKCAVCVVSCVSCRVCACVCVVQCWFCQR
jgi:hypothetical protein